MLVKAIWMDSLCMGFSMMIFPNILIGEFFLWDLVFPLPRRKRIPVLYVF